jgi:putative transcriptional regulator
MDAQRSRPLGASIVNVSRGRDASSSPEANCSRAARSVISWFALTALALLPALVGTAAPRPQNGKEQQQKSERGTFLVARRELNNPLFGSSVVLMLPIKDVPLVVGVIINKPTHVLVRDIFPDSKVLAKQDTTAYFGGPVEFDEPGAIFRSKTPPKKATAVFGDVYVTFDSDTIISLAEDSQQDSTVRIFLGRSQWHPEQLRYEVAEGAWYSTDDDAELIFNSHPEVVWRALVKRLEPRPLV